MASGEEFRFSKYNHELKERLIKDLDFLNAVLNRPGIRRNTILKNCLERVNHFGNLYLERDIKKFREREKLMQRG
jgi:hypothetical protein